MNILVTGCSGFIGSNLTDRLLAKGHCVRGIDNFSTGYRNFLSDALNCDRFSLFEDNLLHPRHLAEAIHGSDLVFHIAANADVRFGTMHPRKDLEENTIVTFNVLEAMRVTGVKRIAFSSTGSIYGEAMVFPTPENAPFPIQTSLYGASKLACEGLISAYCEGFGFRSWIFRFVSVLGERYSHGHVFDFLVQLRRDPGQLHVLGDGRQRKSYLYVHDCIDAVLVAIDKAKDKVNIFNVGVDDYCEVNDSIRWILETLELQPNLYYSGGDRGWIGDNPFIYLDTTKIRGLGWEPKFSIRQGVVSTVEYLRRNDWLFKETE